MHERSRACTLISAGPRSKAAHCGRAPLREDTTRLKRKFWPRGRATLRKHSPGHACLVWEHGDERSTRSKHHDRSELRNYYQTETVSCITSAAPYLPSLPRVSSRHQDRFAVKFTIAEFVCTTTRYIRLRSTFLSLIKARSCMEFAFLGSKLGHIKALPRSVLYS